MVAVTAVLAGVSAGQKVIGGIINSINARKQAEFNQKLLEEQIAVNDILYAREIRAKTGESLVSAAARGVAQSGSVLDQAFDQAFGLQLQRAARNYQLRVEQTKTGVLGQQKSQSAFLTGLKGGLTAAITGAEAVSTARKTSAATADANNTEVLGPPQTAGPSAPDLSSGGFNV